MNWVMAVTNSFTLAEDLLRMACRAMMPKNTSTRLRYEPEVGVKCSVLRGSFASQAWISGCLLVW